MKTKALGLILSATLVSSCGLLSPQSKKDNSSLGLFGLLPMLAQSGSISNNGVFKVKDGANVIGYATLAQSPQMAYFATSQGYYSIAFRVSGSLAYVGASTATYHIAAGCGDAPILMVGYKSTVFFKSTGAIVSSQPALLMTTGSNPASVPGYIWMGSACSTNTLAASQVTGDFVTSTANDPAVTGVPSSISTSFSVVRE